MFDSLSLAIVFKTSILLQIQSIATIYNDTKSKHSVNFDIKCAWVSLEWVN